MSEAEYIEYGKDLDEHIPFQVVPVGVGTVEECREATSVRVMKKIGEILARIGLQQLVLPYALRMITPGVDHLCEVAVIQSDPAIEDTGHYLQQEKDHQLRIIQSCLCKKADPGHQPGEQYQISGKKQVLQADPFSPAKYLIPADVTGLFLRSGT